MNWRAINLLLLGALWGGLAVGLWLPRDRSSAIARAATSDSVPGLAMATGPVTEDSEGIFLLDSSTGVLHCSVFNPQVGQFSAVFRRNVLADLQVTDIQNPRFLICTGGVNVPQRSTQSIGGCLVYVAESTSRKLAVYAVPWQKSLFDSGRAQMGELALLYTGSAREPIVQK